jgi:hypothetical protein
MSAPPFGLLSSSAWRITITAGVHSSTAPAFFATVEESDEFEPQADSTTSNAPAVTNATAVLAAVNRDFFIAAPSWEDS